MVPKVTEHFARLWPKVFAGDRNRSLVTGIVRLTNIHVPVSGSSIVSEARPSSLIVSSVPAVLLHIARIDSVPLRTRLSALVRRPRLIYFNVRLV